MRILMLCLLLLLFDSLYAQTFSSSCVAGTDLQKVYRNDAYKIATDRVRNLHLRWKDSINIPEIYIDSVAKAFYAIDNMAWSRLKDTIRTLFGYADFAAYPSGPQSDSSHIFSCNGFSSGYAVSCKTIAVTVSSSADWYAAWQSGNYNNTPNPAINSLIDQYGITVTPWVDVFPSQRTFYLRTSKAINPYGLSLAFIAVNGTLSSQPVSVTGDGNSIDVEYHPDGISLSFRNGCGDCPAGCTYGRAWHFKYFFADCSIGFLGANNLGGTYDQIFNGAPFTCINTVMPVEFSPLLVRMSNQKPLLEWQVYSQVNVEEYIVERSLDGAEFYPVATIPASTAGVGYSWTDNSLVTGFLYYRVKAVGSNGEVRYSGIATIRLNSAETMFVVSNPVVDKKIILQVKILQQQKLKWSVMNYTGQKIYFNELNVSPGTHTLHLQLPQKISGGLYIISLIIDNSTINKTIVIN